jgi:hypothetical protein
MSQDKAFACHICDLDATSRLMIKPCAIKSLGINKRALPKDIYVVCMLKVSNKCYVSRMCWSNMIGIEGMIAKLCGGTEDDLKIVLYIAVPHLGRW